MGELIEMLKENNYEFTVIENDVFVPIGEYNGIMAIRWNEELERYNIIAKYKDDDDRIYRYICYSIDEIEELINEEM